MTHLQCGVMNCANNAHQYCCRPTIKVDGQNAQQSQGTCCSSYEPRSNGISNFSGYDIPNPEIEIACDAMNCTYNNSGQCAADSINVDVLGVGASNREQTACASFRLS